MNTIKTSKEFKKHAGRAVASIVLFSLVYLILFLFALALTAACAFGGIWIITNYPKFITLMLGIGLASLGIIVLIFLFKFIFKSVKTDRSHLLEIKRKDEPMLFSMIDEIVKDVKTHFPKKIYLSHKVNASVFYDSSFLSMFLPIKKNLVIGIGLASSVSRLELKAILAHEFGHFSQQSMKVGSYVYSVNHIIHNLLYDDESFNSMIGKWANASGYFSIFVVLAVKIIQGIQWVLKKMYEIVNVSYMGLSREMEFHADEIAANITGSKPLDQALLRFELADHSYNSVMEYYGASVEKGIITQNLYQNHTFVMKFLAERDGIPIVNELPQVTLNELNKFNKSKLVIKDQWASHPSVQERVEKLRQLNINKDKDKDGSSSELFEDFEKCQESLTKRLFDSVPTKDISLNTNEEFASEYKTQYAENSFDVIYNGYYDIKDPEKVDYWNSQTSNNISDFEELFSNEKTNMVYESASLKSDLETINGIAVGNFKVKTYDYDGKKYYKKDSFQLIKQLKKEVDKLNTLITENDEKIYQYFKSIESKYAHDRLDSLYKNLFAMDEDFNKKIQLYNTITSATQFINFTTPFEVIKQNFIDLEPFETQLKSEIREIAKDNRYSNELNEEIKESFEKYLQKNYQYFGNEVYFDENLEILFSALNNYHFIISKSFFNSKKQLLAYKKNLLDEGKVNLG